MSLRVPPGAGPSLLDLIRMQIPLPAAAGREGGAPRRTVPLAWEKMPPAVIRVLAEAAVDGLPLESLLPSVPRSAYNSIGPASPDASGDRTTAQSRVVARLILRADQGTMSVEELNQFLALASLGQGVVQRAAAELGRDPGSLYLNGALYRLVQGKMVPVQRASALAVDASKLWLQTALIVAIAALIAAALMLFS